MKTVAQANEVLGFCKTCIRNRWLRLVHELGDPDFDHNLDGYPQGVCFTCAREEDAARDDGA